MSRKEHYFELFNLHCCTSDKSLKFEEASLVAQMVKNPPIMQESLILGLGRSPGERNIYLLQSSGLENSMDCVVHGVLKSRTLLSDFQPLSVK